MKKNEKILGVDELLHMDVMETFNEEYKAIIKQIDMMLSVYIELLADFEDEFDKVERFDEVLLRLANRLEVKYDEGYFEKRLMEYIKNAFHNGICQSCNLRICIDNPILDSEKSIFKGGIDPEIASKTQNDSFKKQINFLDSNPRCKDL